MANKQDYTTLGYKNEEGYRFRIIDNKTGKVLDDANCYGYKFV